MDRREIATLPVCHPLYRMVVILFATIGLLFSTDVVADDAPVPVACRPVVPGTFRLALRHRDKKTGEPRVEQVDWQVSETAIIVCDMWDGHYCELSKQRVEEMIPKMNDVLSAARSHGVQIIHAPSNTMDVYAGTPYRRRMQQASFFETPVPVGAWCDLDPEVEPELPIVAAMGTCCDDPVVHYRPDSYTRQHVGLDIIGFDGISDSGQEIYNLCRQLGIRNIVMTGVHTNMCVLGRPFGIRQQVKLGMNVVLVRDLTDTMYDPRQPPYVSHERGTELVVEHIERYWCPSIASNDLMSVVPGSADPTGGGS